MTSVEILVKHWIDSKCQVRQRMQINRPGFLLKF